MSDTILVLGGTGKTGSRVAGLLAERGQTIRIGSRRGRPPFDWENQQTWGPALQGVTAAYIAYAPDAGFPGAAETIDAFARYAVRNGPRRLVLLTGRGERGALRSEHALRDSGAEWTVVRASVFNQNFSEDFLAQGVRDGLVAFPAQEVAEPFIDVHDIAEVAVAALTQGGHANRTYEVTGPRALTFSDAVGEIAAATSRSITYVPISPAQFTAGAIEAGMSHAMARQLTELLTEVLDGRNAGVAAGVHDALGRGPTDFADFAARAAASGFWSP